MHGIIEVAALYAFAGTLIAALALRLCKPPKPLLVVSLVGCWPVFLGLVMKGNEFLGTVGMWLTATVVTLPAAWLGSAIAVALLRRRRTS